MDFLVNDLSVAGRFREFDSFNDAIARLMRIRQDIQRLGSSLYCHRNLLQAKDHARCHHPASRSTTAEVGAERLMRLVDDARPVLG